MKKIVFLTGAGMSVESGFKTFRGSDGLWEDYPVEQVATHEALENDPALVINFYNRLRKKLFASQPNEGHKLISALEKDYDVTVITQNVDDLHERGGSSHVIHLHGELKKMCSSADAYNPDYIETLTEDNWEVIPGTKAKDGSMLRPFIVFFGEAVPMIEEAAREVSQADLFVIVGTSLNVYPAAGLVRYVPIGAPIYLIDPNEVTQGKKCDVTVIRKGATEGLQELFASIKP
ncbi:SIR2 family NAD-dependent protein deacylase [Prevotella ihumii]|uniref:SIR2 family NAD-dependent protein deacylase n=1 Tax=Prevotella ihumii TaxID=1917878 RepID=UPI0009821002|nr:NAD-dependent deacylase [Prevotella ihumii]